MQSCVSPISDKSIREIQTGDHFINVLELWKNGDTVPRSLTKNGFIDSLEELRLPLRDLRMLVKSSDTIRTRFPSLLPRPSSKCYIFEIEHIRFLCFRRASLPKQSFLNHLCPPHLSWHSFHFSFICFDWRLPDSVTTASYSTPTRTRQSCLFGASRTGGIFYTEMELLLAVKFKFFWIFGKIFTPGPGAVPAAGEVRRGRAPDLHADPLHRLQHRQHDKPGLWVRHTRERSRKYCEQIPVN